MPENTLSKIHIDIPDNVGFIIKTLEDKGFEAYAVGGCVRDTLIGRTPGDWDITTSALPHEIKSCFRRTVDTGIEHGTVTVMFGSESYEVTTYRIDGEYRDNRHPDSVSFTSSVREDLRRRDFTINAMAYNERTGILDLFGGCEDLKAGIIRCVGDADERFDEDALRILRAVRFAAQLDFRIEEHTANAVKKHAINLQAVSKERILTEITKLICSAHIERIFDIFELGLAPYISEHFDEINISGLKELITANDTIEGHDRYLSAEERRALDDAFDYEKTTSYELRFARFAMLAEGMKPEHVKKMIKGLKPDNDTLHNTELLIKLLYVPLSDDRYELKTQMTDVPPKLFYCLLRLKAVSCRTKLYNERCRNEKLENVIALYEDIMKTDEPIYLKELAVNGGDLISRGVKPGPELGKMLKRLLDLVHREPQHNNKNFLKEKTLNIL